MSYVYIFKYNHSLIKKYQPDLLHLATSFFPGWGFLWGNWHWCLHSCGICWTKSFWWSAFRQHSKSWLSCCGMNYRVYMYLFWLSRIWPRVIMLSNYLYYLTPDKENIRWWKNFVDLSTCVFIHLVLISDEFCLQIMGIDVDSFNAL